MFNANAAKSYSNAKVTDIVLIVVANKNRVCCHIRSLCIGIQENNIPYIYKRFMKNKQVTIRRKRGKNASRKSRKHAKRTRKSHSKKSRTRRGGTTPKKQEILDKLLQKAIQNGNTVMIEKLLAKGAEGDDDFQNRASPNHLITSPGDDERMK